MMLNLRVPNCFLCSLLWAVICISSYGAETYSTANAVNDSSVIAGAKYGSYPYVLRATMWFRDVLVFDLGTLPGGTSSEALGINNFGQVVGYSTTSDGSTHAFLWHLGRMHDLGTLGPDYVFSRANGVNDRGEVVGVSCKQAHSFVMIHDPFPPPNDPSCRAFLWKQGHMYNLGVYPGGTFSAAQAINNKGQVVGSGDVPIEPDSFPEYHFWPYTTRALLWNNGTPTAIPSVSPCLCGLIGTGINNLGVVIGMVETPYIATQAFSWKDGEQTNFGLNGGAGEPITAAMGINNRGQIVGWRYGSFIAGVDTPFLFQNDKLVSLPTRDPHTWGAAEAINESGLIVGSDSDQAVMWEHGAIKALK